MPRPVKKRRVCSMPRAAVFSPPGKAGGNQGTIVLSVDEYETLRLIDLENYTQDECSRQMQVARTTVQAIYREARRKTADAIVNAKKLEISGGDYRLCENYHGKCKCGCNCSACMKVSVRVKEKTPSAKAMNSAQAGLTRETKKGIN